MSSWPVLIGIVLLGTLAGPAQAEWYPDPYTGGVPVNQEWTNQYSPAVLEDGSGGAYIAWLEASSGDGTVTLQHIDRDGELLWSLQGAVIGGPAGEVTLCPDGAGGLFVFWSQQSLAGSAVYGQRVSGSGVFLWTLGGVILSGTGGTSIQWSARSHLEAIPDGAGGAFIVWEQLPGDRFGTEYLANVYLQRIDGTGARLWGTNGIAVLANASYEQVNPNLLPDGAGGVIVSWDNGQAGAAYVYLKRFNSASVLQWTVTCTGPSVAVNFGSALTADGSNGVIVSWTHNYADIRAQRISVVGTALWGGTGTAICTAAGTQEASVVVGDGAGGAEMAWVDYRNPQGPDIYAQAVNSSGTALWALNGIPVSVAVGPQSSLKAVTDGEGGAYLAWVDSRYGLSSDLFACRLTGSGSVLPQSGRAVCRAADTQGATAAAVDGRGGALLVWQDRRTGNYDIYAQRIESFGYLGDPAPRILAVEDIPGDQGGKVKLSWSTSYLDDEFAPSTFDYMVWRELSPGGWEQLATQISGPLPQYSLVVPTLADAGPGNPQTAYRVEARWDWNAQGPFWLSPPDSGISVDDFPPLAPAGLEGVYAMGVSTLTWLPGPEADLAGYRIYRGTSPHFSPTPENRLAEVSSVQFEDPAGAPHAYRVTALDRNGNESPAAAWTPAGFTGTPQDTGPRLALAVPSPNPARSSTSLEFALPGPSRATLAVWDVAGRLVREVAIDRFEAGPHRLEWDLRDRSGVNVAPGTYFVRLVVQGNAPLTQALIVVR